MPVIRPMNPVPSKAAISLPVRNLASGQASPVLWLQTRGFGRYSPEPAPASSAGISRSRWEKQNLTKASSLTAMLTGKGRAA